MNTTPTDRRGLGELVSLCTVVAATLIAFIACLSMNEARDAAILFGLLVGQIQLLAARGTQGAMQRDAVAEKSQPAIPPPPS